MKSANNNLWSSETFPHSSAYRGQNAVLVWSRFEAHELYPNIFFLLGTCKIDFNILILAHDLTVQSTSEFILSPCLKLLRCRNSAFSAILILSEYGAEIQGVGRLNYDT
jgi:hypothetical protein